MNDAEYRRLCAAPNVLRRADIRSTVARLREREPRLAEQLTQVLRSSPVPKPAEHQGGPETDYLGLDLSPEDIQSIVDALFDLEAELAQDPRTERSDLSSAAALVDLWNGAESTRKDAV